MRKQQKGFTLIELVMVIVILGVLAAFALPRFANLSGDAETAVCMGGLAAAKSASGIFHAKWLAQGSPTAAITDYDGGGSYIPTAGGYPDGFDIIALAGLDSSFVSSMTASDDTDDTEVNTFTVGTSGNTFTYDEATGIAAAGSSCI